MQRFKLWQNAWKNEKRFLRPVNIELPNEWDVKMLSFPADLLPQLTMEQMRAKINAPEGMPLLREYARGGKEAIIVFDDVSRGTQVQPLAEIVLEELHEAGIKKDHIRFLCALGNHGAHTRIEFAMKLGEQIVEEYPVFNHNPYENNRKIGEDFLGRDVLLNREYLNCDVRVGIGMVCPHPMCGYGGGGKILFPGICSIDTTLSNHMRNEDGIMGDITPNGLRDEIENMTAMAGSLFKIDAVVNSHLDTVNLFAGDALAIHRSSLEKASGYYALHYDGLKDVVVANINVKTNEPDVANPTAEFILKPGGDLVFVNFCPWGRVEHYVYGQFGRNYGGKAALQAGEWPAPRYGRLIFYTPYPEYKTRYGFSKAEDVIFCKTWEQVLSLLSAHGPDTTAAVISDATVGYFPEMTAWC